MSRLACVVTTIQPPTRALRAVGAALPPDALFLVVGDRKGPRSWDYDRAELIPFERQGDLPYALARALPANHYSRKNLGYLEAIARGATPIFETDDDNEPLAHWAPRERACAATEVAKADWINVYALFSDELVWPRGLPLKRVRDPRPERIGPPVSRDCPIQQALADASPDVDAIWRLVLDKNVTFERSPSAWLPPGAACPFNSQVTWWWPPAFPLLYLPSACSIRMTDIWRGFVAQRCLWELGHGMVFHASEVLQLRNEHDLQRDFEDEIEGYTRNDRILNCLRATTLEPGADAVGRNLLACWRALADAGLSSPAELPLVEAWLSDLAALGAA